MFRKMQEKARCTFWILIFLLFVLCYEASFVAAMFFFTSDVVYLAKIFLLGVFFVVI